MRCRLHPILAALTTSATLVGGCTSSPAPTGPAVSQVGAMRAVMREGRSEPRVAIDAVVTDETVIAVGMEPALAGEITALDGRCWTTRVAERDADGVAALETVDLLTAPDAAATMLTSSRVTAWSPRTLAFDADLDALLAAAETLARDRGFDADAALPLVVEAPHARLSAHVAAGACPHGDPEGAALSPPWRFEGETEGLVTLVGFRIVGGGGVSTHHGRRDHLHALFEVNGELVSAHVDDVAVPAGSRIKVPAAR